MPLAAASASMRSTGQLSTGTPSVQPANRPSTAPAIRSSSRSGRFGVLPPSHRARMAAYASGSRSRSSGSGSSPRIAASACRSASSSLSAAASASLPLPDSAASAAKSAVRFSLSRRGPKST